MTTKRLPTRPGRVDGDEKLRGAPLRGLEEDDVDKLSPWTEEEKRKTAGLEKEAENAICELTLVKNQYWRK